MKGKQISVMDEVDRFEIERKKRETDAIMARLDEKCRRMSEKELLNQPDGSVVIIGQSLFRNGHYARHFYRTVMTFAQSGTRGRYPVFVQAENEEWPETPPWAQVVNHEDEPRDINYFQEHIHWATGEVTEPIVTWWQKRWGM